MGFNSGFKGLSDAARRRVAERRSCLAFGE